MSRFKRFFWGVVEFFDGIGARKIWTYAAAGTFYLFLSIVPIVALLGSILPYTPLTQEVILSILDGTVPPSVYTLLEELVGHIYDSSTTTLSISAVLSVWSASLSILAIMRGMDAAYDLKRRENAILFRLRACFFMVVMLAAILVTLCAIVYGQKILTFIQSTLKETWAVNLLFTILQVARYIVMLLVLFTIFICLYKWMPTGRRKLSRQWYGALFTTLAWLIFSSVFSVYVGVSDRYGIYGVLGTVIVAMLWMYYCLFFLLVGGYINRYVDIKRLERLEHKMYGPPPPPNDGRPHSGIDLPPVAVDRKKDQGQ